MATHLERQLEASIKMNDRALAVVEEHPSALARIDEEMGLEVDAIAARVAKVHAVSKRLMKSGHHYGIVPGTKDKMALFKPGAELLTLTFQLDPQFSLDERRDDDGHFECIVTCTLYHAPSGRRLGSGVGSCSTRESKYAWRKGERVCPTCGNPAIIKGQEQYGGGWVCFAKKGGCKAKFRDDDKRITEQQVGRIPNPDLADTYNTVRKMGCKRAHVASVLFVTCASELFTQDLEEDVEMGHRYEDPSPRADTGGAHSPHASSDNADGDPELAARLLDRLERALLVEGERFDLYDASGNLVDRIKTPLRPCTDYDTALSMRAFLGTREKMSDWAKSLQAARESLNGLQNKLLSKVWAHCDRQVAKLEQQLKTDATAAFTDAADEGDDFDRGNQ